jgi:hypothetical protein
MTGHDIPTFPAFMSWLMRFAWRARVAAETCRQAAIRPTGIGLWRPIMNNAFSFSISIGIIAFGIWIAAGTIGAGSHLAWVLIGLLPVIVGSISLYLAIREIRVAPLN